MKKEDFREKSYWLTTRPYSPFPALSGDKTVEVAVVGGGFTGLSTAYHLKKADPALSVALLEGQVIGFGASGRNGGFNMTLFGLTLSVTALRFGRARAREAHLYMERAVDTLRDLVALEKISCDYEHPGFLRVATSRSYEKRIRHEVELAHKLGLSGISWMEADRVQEEVKSPVFGGAWWEPRCGILNPAKLSFGWRDVISNLGVAVYEQSPVISIQKTPGGVRLSTPGGSVTAKKAVLATNAYSHLIPALRTKQTPVWTRIVLTEPLSPERMAAIGWQNRQGIEDARNLVHYFRLTADNRILMGGRDVGLSTGLDMDKDNDPVTFEGLENDVRQVFPQISGVRFTHRWGGPVSVTTDMAPALGFLGDERLVYSVGCVGHGVSLTHLNGRTVSDLVLGRKSDLTSVFFVNRKVLPWPPDPVRFVAAKAILAAMRLDDRVRDRM